MKTEVKLYGILSKEYGSTFKFFNIKKPLDAIKAIETTNEGFIKSIQNKSLMGMNYEIITDGETENCFSMSKNKDNIKIIEIVPCITGEVPAAFFVALGYGATTAAALSTFATALIVGIAIAGITYLLTPIPDAEVREMEASIKGGSFIFSSPDNIAAQGQPVPVGYGRLRVGSQVISSDLKNKNKSEIANPFASAGADYYINFELIANKFKENV